MSEKNLQIVLSSPGQKLAKFLHTIKTKFRSEKVAEIRPLKPYIPEGAVIFDIGAHFGQYAKVFAKLNKSSVKVYCFEPVNYTRDILTAVLEKHPNTIIFSNGFSNKSGVLNINIPIKTSGKIGPGIASICEERDRDYVVQEAHIDTIDNFMKQHNVNRLDFIKIDIEGPEYLVFKGAIKTLQKFKPTIYCEVVAEQMLKLDIKTDELFNFMTNLGYQSHVFRNAIPSITAGYEGPADYLFLHSDMLKDIKRNERFGYYSPQGFIKVIHILIKIGIGFGKLKKIYAKILTRINKKNPIDIIYHGVKFRLYPHNNTIESKMFVSSRLREGKELDVISGFIKNGGTFLDIGANIGYYSLMAAKLGATKIIGVEPNPIVLDRFKANIKFNGFEKQIKTFQIGIGEKQGTMELRLSQTDMGGSSIINTKLNSDKIKIKVIPLSELLKKEGITKVDVLKIDIEGFEDRALFPYFETLNKKHYPRLILMEDSSQTDWDENILEWLLANGYRVLARTRGNVLITTEE